jgi:hypothetical protein
MSRFRFAFLLGVWVVAWGVRANCENAPHGQETASKAVLSDSLSLKDLLRKSEINGLMIDPIIFNADVADLVRGNVPNKSGGEFINLAELDEKDPRWTPERLKYWKGIVYLLWDLGTEVAKKIPGSSAGNLAAFSVIIPDFHSVYEGGGINYIQLSDLRDPSYLRYTLYRKALARAWAYSPGNQAIDIAYPKENSVRSTTDPPDIAGFSATQILASLFSGVGADSTQVPGPLTSEHSTRHYLAHHLADRVETTDPKRALAMRRAANAEYVDYLVHGMESGGISSIAVAQPLKGLLQDFLKTPGTKITSEKLDQLLVDSLSDPAS